VTRDWRYMTPTSSVVDTMPTIATATRVCRGGMADNSSVRVNVERSAVSRFMSSPFRHVVAFSEWRAWTVVARSRRSPTSSSCSSSSTASSNGFYRRRGHLKTISLGRNLSRTKHHQTQSLRAKSPVLIQDRTSALQRRVHYNRKINMQIKL